MSRPRTRGRAIRVSTSRRELSSSRLQSFLRSYVPLSDPRLRGQDACSGLRRSSEVPPPGRSPAALGPGRAAAERRARGGPAAPRRGCPAQLRAPARRERRARAVGAGPRRGAGRRRREARRDGAAAPAPPRSVPARGRGAQGGEAAGPRHVPRPPQSAFCRRLRAGGFCVCDRGAARAQTSSSEGAVRAPPEPGRPPPASLSAAPEAAAAAKEESGRRRQRRRPSPPHMPAPGGGPPPGRAPRRRR